MFDWKNQTQMQEVYQIILQRNCPQATSLWTSHQKEKCTHCGETINRANNLEKHLRSCEKAPTHPTKRQLRQTALDGPTSSENGPSTPKKLIVEEVQVDGAPAEHAGTLEGTRNSRVCLKVHGSDLQKDIQQQQQKRRPAAIEGSYP